MGTSQPSPASNELPQQLWDSATTLTPEAQNAGLRKAQELGLDLNRGRIPLAETLINLDHARATILDVVEKNKVGQLPLKLQHLLLAQAQRVSQNLQSLVAGMDTVQGLEDSVDDLTASIWQYNLQNLSGEVLGFAQKMNQLKRQETIIREAHRAAEAFSGSRARAEEILANLSELDTTAKAVSAAIAEASSKSETLLNEITKNSEVTKITVAEIDAHATSALKAAEACSSTSGTATELLAQLEATRDRGTAVVERLDESLKQASGQLSAGKAEADDLFKRLSENCERVEQSLRDAAKETEEALTQSISEVRDNSKAELDTATTELRKATELQTQTVTDLVTNSQARLEQAEKAQKISTDGSLRQFEKLTEVKLKEIETEFRRVSAEAEAKGNASIEKNDTELMRLTAELEKLEGRIRESINRATGYTLFHSFQKRQEDLAKAKLFWAVALGVTVLLSLAASGMFIYSLQFVHEYNAAFYLKLSISLPIIYAIAFCNLQYSKERTLEEEYAFKSTISISLDPYQQLIRSVVDESKSDEMSKYTAFLIESVNRVFTPPTAHHTSEGEAKSGDLVEGILKSVGKFCEPFLSVVKK